MLSSTVISSTLATPLLVATVVLLLAAAVHDVGVRTVPNAIPVLLLAVGLVLRIDSQTLVPGLVAMMCVFTVTALMWIRGWMGGGDVKLYASCSLVVAPSLVLPFILATALAGGVLALLYLLLRAVLPRKAASAGPAGVRPSGLIARALRCERRRIRQGGPLPYAAAIAAGALFTLVAA